MMMMMMIIIIIIIIITISKNLTQRKKLSMSLLVGQCLFDEKENKFDSCRREDFVEKLCKNLKNGAMKIINYEKK